MGAEAIGILGSGNVNIAISVTQLLVLWLLIRHDSKLGDLWKWHQPVMTDTGERFTWKHDQELVDQVKALVAELAEQNRLTRGEAQ